MQAKFAFTAQFWGDGAVVCRAVEHRPGPVVEQQFGEFPTWTQAQAFAAKLNEGLDLDCFTVRRIVTSSFLATACVLQEALNSSHSWIASAPQVAARTAQLRLLLAELALALTLCRSATHLSQSPARRALLQARKTLYQSTQFLKFFDGDYPELQNIAERAQSLDAAVQHLSACLDDESST